MAFSFSTAAGIIFAKIINLFLREGRRIDPCIGAAGVFRSMLRWDTIEGSVPPSEREGNR